MAGLTAKLRPDCVERLKGLSEFRLLLAAPGFEGMLASRKPPEAFRQTLQGWSTDLLIAVRLQLRQEIGACQPLPPALERVAAELELAYLKRLGFAEKTLRPDEREAGFRIFLTTKDDIEVLRKAIAAAPPAAPRATAQVVYRQVREVRGVPVLGGSPAQGKALKAFVDALCPGRSPCLFWEPLSLYRVVLSVVPGLAAYLPEVATLVLSESLLEKPNRLHQLVVLHELAHVAERGAWLRDRRDWKKEFAREHPLPAKAAELAPSWNDELTKLSQDDPFSLLPDPVLEGFVFAKTFRESSVRADASEDLADHVAAYRFAPERFCFGKIPVAAGKAAWVRRNVFKNDVAPSPCSR